MSESTDTKQVEKEKKKPKYAFKTPTGQGQVVEVAVFEFDQERDGQDYKTESVLVHRSYHDGKQWRRSQGFRPSDLPAVSMALQHVWHHLMKDRNG